MNDQQWMRAFYRECDKLGVEELKTGELRRAITAKDHGEAPKQAAFAMFGPSAMRDIPARED